MSDLQRIRVWADALIALHLDDSWSFGFDNAKRRAGLCDYTRRRISVSRYLSARYDDDLEGARADFKRELFFRQQAGAPEEQLESTLLAIDAVDRRRVAASVAS